MTPRRVQHRRGVKLPPNSRLVARPSRWGNPFKVEATSEGRWRVVIPDWFHWSGDIVTEFGDRARAHERAVDLYSIHAGPMGSIELADEDIEAIRGLNLACYCPPDLPCHADILLRWANT